MAQVRTEDLRKLTKDILVCVGVPQEQADIIADTVVYAHTHGKETHGITRIPIYIRKISDSLMAADTKLIEMEKTPVMCVLDAQGGFGQIAAYKGMRFCMERAKEYGLALCGIRNSNNFGVAGYFTEMSTRENMIGIIMSASAPAIAPAGGKKPIFGTNPISIAFPVPAGNAPVILDMATSEVARGKIRMAEKNGEKIPYGWALDSEGQPTDDPAKALLGTMLPIGGYKGAGIAMAVDILAGLLTGNLFGGDIKPLNEPEVPSSHGHLLMAIDISKLMLYEEYLAKINALKKRMHECGDDGKVWIPGERSYTLASQSGDSVEIKDNLIKDMQSLADKFGIRRRLG